MQTEVTRLLGIEYPIIQGGMAWVAEHKNTIWQQVYPKPADWDSSVQQVLRQTG